MHVALMAGSLTRGGTERVLVNLADYLISRGDTVTVVTLSRYENEYELNKSATRIVWDLDPCEITSNRVKNFIKRINKLKSIWNEFKPDVILSFIGKNNFMALLTAPKSIPVAVSIRAIPWMEYPTKLSRLVAYLLYGKAATVILQTKNQDMYFSKKAKSKSVVMKNPIDSRFLVEPYDGERDKVIVSVGRVDENKNHKMIIDAFATIAKKYPDWKVVIYGDGDLRQNLLKYVDSMGLSGRIELPGNVPDVAEKIKKTSVFILSSNTEGSPNSLIEAMCLGLAPISTDCTCGGMDELIQNGVNGYVVPVGDTLKMQETLQNLLCDLQRILDISEKTRGTRDIYQPEKVLGEWREVLKNLTK